MIKSKRSRMAELTSKEMKQCEEMEENEIQLKN